ncbi:LytTR family DNA-binding domain-containing protein [Undibacterium sp.]|jgi:DNA-binding LytR/AlgR family response regulator|uniref:LytR/AlgR family response regulator transcription factor n=1 Tax=Undibacterium sp. TaxID=1914977 RepID=UPI002C151187|nr:LytTR family DNA-binding domain-containing protein [Undibacterium sp.]HTD05014.1 LytTR family DNA-binding domain-containing protein [Undibacterium sp.]
MTQLRALVAEDESILSYALLQTLGRLWPELQICGVVENGIAAVQEALAQLPDVLFLDIKMPGKTGLEVAQELAEEWPEGSAFPLIVFVTAYDEYAIQAFEHSASDYVLKPVNDERLGKTVGRLKARLDNNQERSSELERVVGQLRHLIPQAPADAERLEIIRAAVGNQIRMIPVADVLYFEATDKYVNVVTAEHSSLIRTSLRDLLPQLDSKLFWQIHRSTVVNTRHVQVATRDETGKLTLKLRGSNDSLHVSRVYAHLFKQM